MISSLAEIKVGDLFLFKRPNITKSPNGDSMVVLQLQEYNKQYEFLYLLAIYNGKICKCVVYSSDCKWLELVG